MLTMLGFRFVLVLSLSSMLSFMQLHGGSSTFFNFRDGSQQRFAFIFRDLKLGVLSILEPLILETFMGRVNAL